MILIKKYIYIIININLKNIEIINGTSSTFIGWEKQYKSVIDFIFYKNIQCIQYGILLDQLKSGLVMYNNNNNNNNIYKIFIKF